MPLGDPALQPVAPEFRDTWEWGEPDLIVTLEEPFAVPPDGPDIYRNFAIDLGLSEDRWVQAMAFHPAAKSAAHHAQFFFDATGASRQLQRQDPEPGVRPHEWRGHCPRVDELFWEYHSPFSCRIPGRLGRR